MFNYLQQHYEKRTSTGALYALLFDNTGVSTGHLLSSIPEDELTIELMFKPLRQGGTLISYANLKTFAITINFTLKLHLGKSVIDTSIPVQLHRWCQISIVWNIKEKALQLYKFDENKNVVRRRYNFDESPFPSGGILSLGLWELSPGDTESQTKPTFFGIIDEVRIWKRLFDPVWIQQNIGMNVLPSDPGISAIWKINEGEGNVVKNLVNNEHMYLALPPWKRPLWISSDAPVKHQYTSTSMPFEAKFTSKDSESEITRHCRMLFFETELFTSCKRLHAELEMFYMICLQNVAESGDLTFSMNTVITFADHCQEALNLPFWPAKTLCNTMPGSNKVMFPDWIGDKCETKCLFGTVHPKYRSSCNCIAGFWGETCNIVCPAGIIQPCNKHGNCNSKSGVCSCDINWSGSDDCSLCSPGWYGDNCQYVLDSTVAKKNYSVAIASVFGQGFFFGFDGIGLNLKKYGEYIITRSNIDNFAVQIRQSVCVTKNKYHNLCNIGFAVRYKNIVIVVRAPVTNTPEARNTPLVWLNSRTVVVNHVTQLSLYFRMTRTSSVTYSIEGPNNIRFDVRVGKSLSFTCHIPRPYCVNSTGLLGSCLLHDGPLNETMLEKQVQTRKLKSSVSDHDTLFVYKYDDFTEPRVITGAGFGLVFTDSYVVSQSLNLQEFNILTVELLVNIKMYGGVILSYSSPMNTFALINYKTLTINYRGQVYDTGLSLEVRKWNQISLEFSKYLYTLKIYVFDSTGAVQIRVLQLDKDIWRNGGILALGQWLPSRDNSKPPKSSFFGKIDELRIWNRTSNADLVKSTWRLNVQPEKYQDLLHLWKMNQVQGRVVQDLVGSRDLILKKFHQPSWDFSDATVSLPEVEETKSDDVFEEKSKSFCSSLLLKGTLFDKCKSIGKQIAEFYYQGCLRDTSMNMNINAAINSVLSYADYCQTALLLPTWPAQELCNKFEKEQFPYWLGKFCDIGCVFGKPVISENNTNEVKCGCEYGYWGTQCENLCPGGLFNVCNGHGTCDVINGTCSCEPRRSSNPDGKETSVLPCSKCSEGWIGENCDVAFTNNTFKSGMTVGFGDPHFTTLTGISYHVETPGAFLLLNTPNVTAQILQTPCNDRVSCRRISELALRTSTFLLTVRYADPATIDTMVEDFNTGKTLPLQRKQSWVAFTSDEKSHYRWPTPNILETVLPNREKVTILFYNGNLGTAIEMPNAQNNTLGLGGEKTGNWITSLQGLRRANDTQVSTQDLINTNLTSYVRLSDKDNVLRNNFSNHNFDGAGFMLGFAHGHLISEEGEEFPVLKEFTLEFWICIVNDDSSIQSLCSNHDEKRNVTDKPIQAKHTLFSTTVTNPMSEFAAIYESTGLSVTWNDQIVKTNLTVSEGVWTHLAVTWRSNDGRLHIITNSSTSYSTFTAYGIQIGKQFDLTGSLAFGKYYQRSRSFEEDDLRGALDEIRLWQYAKTEQEISSLRYSKFDYYIEGLLLSMPLDQGFGTSVNALKYPRLDEQMNTIVSNQSETVFKLIQFHVRTEDRLPMWLPSGVKSSPLTNYTVAFYNNSLKVQAHKLCHKWFYTGNVQNLCSSPLVSQARFYFEACLADIADGGSLAHHKLSISLFGFYCQNVLGIEKCKLHGTYDAFPPCYTEGRDVDFPIIIVTIIITVLVVIVIILCCCLVRCVRKRRRRKPRRKETAGGYLDEPEVEMYTMYSAESGNIGLETMLQKKIKTFNAKVEGDTNKIIDMHAARDDDEEQETDL